MRRELELLAAKKQLLMTQASLQRLHAANQVGALRERVRLPASVASALSNPDVRSLALSALLLSWRRPRLARAALITGIVFMVVKFFRRARARP